MASLNSEIVFYVASIMRFDQSLLSVCLLEVEVDSCEDFF